jgi:membrane protein implicated in regulation of membrane protease activity
MIFDILDQLGPWAWFIAGLVLLVLELALPGNVFVWFGIAAILTGIVILIVDFGWPANAVIFVVLSVVTVVVGRRHFARGRPPGE